MRIPYIPDPPPSIASAGQEPQQADEAAAIVARIRARRAPRPLQPLDRALLHAPAVADGWNAFLGAVRTRTSLALALRELAVCRVAVVNRAWYEWMHHAPLAVAAGVAEGAMREMVAREGVLGWEDARRYEASRVGRGGSGAAGLGEREWAVLVLADEMTRNVEVEDATFARVKGLFSEKEVVELVATIACYNCVSRFLVALDVGEKNGTGPDLELEH